MKKFPIILSAALIALMLAFPLACSTRDGDEATDSPLAMNTAGTTREPLTSPDMSESPVGASTSPDVSGTPDALMSANPTEDASFEPSLTEPGATEGRTDEPSTTASRFESEIEDFMEGRVVDPETIPDIVAMLEREFPGHDIQSATHEYINGYQTYRIVLQGSGELSRTLYVLSDGTIIMPSETD